MAPILHLLQSRPRRSLDSTEKILLKAIWSWSQRCANMQRLLRHSTTRRCASPRPCTSACSSPRLYRGRAERPATHSKRRESFACRGRRILLREASFHQRCARSIAGRSPSRRGSCRWGAIVTTPVTAPGSCVETKSGASATQSSGQDPGSLEQPWKSLPCGRRHRERCRRR